MKIISHRGNLSGSNPDMENHPSYILQAVDAGYDVEVDVWWIDDGFFLGHDTTQYRVELNWLESLPLWCHAKNEEAFSKMLATNLHFFWHETDRFTMTSRKIPWCFPGNYQKHGVTVIKQSPREMKLDREVFGICTDYPIEWRTTWKSSL